MAVIYAMRTPSGLFKLGFSDNVKRRAREHRKAKPSLVLVCAIEGDERDEMEMLDSLSEERVCGEWFRGPRTQAFVDSGMRIGMRGWAFWMKKMEELKAEMKEKYGILPYSERPYARKSEEFLDGDSK